MKLYTRHLPDFDPSVQVSLPFEHSATIEPMFNGDDMFAKAYRYLFERIGTDRVIWCHPVQVPIWRTHALELKTWYLDVPDDQVVAYIDSDIWNYAINNWPYSDLIDQWYEEAEKLYPDDANAYDKYIEDKEAELEKTQTREEQYKDLVTDCLLVEDRYTEILIPSPIDPEWIVRVEHASDWDKDFADTGIISHGGFGSAKEANEFVDVCESFLNGLGYPYKKIVTKNKDSDYSVKFEGWEHLVDD